MKNRYIIWSVITVHLLMGCILLFKPSMAPLAFIVGLHGLIHLFTTQVAAAMLIVASLFAIPGMFRPMVTWRDSYWIIPQYVLMILSISSIALTIAVGHLPGSPAQAPRLALVTAAIPLASIALWHSVAVLSFWLAPEWKRKYDA